MRMADCLSISMESPYINGMAGPRASRSNLMTDDTWRTALPNTWLGPDGETVSCTEKLKVLEENLAEIAELAQDALEDAILMGVAEDQARRTLAGVIEQLKNPYRK